MKGPQRVWGSKSQTSKCLLEYLVLRKWTGSPNKALLDPPVELPGSTVRKLYYLLLGGFVPGVLGTLKM